MSEITTPLLRLAPGETFTADEDGALVITERNSHADILRYVASDIGSDATFILDSILVASDTPSPVRSRQ